MRLQLRFADPLVDLRQLRHRAVLGADLAAVLLGIALYMFLTVVTEFVQTPSAQGFGFGGTTLRRRPLPRPLLADQPAREPG